MNWYYFSEGREVGPLSVTALGEIRASGGIADETPVRREDSAEWEAYSTAFPSKLETPQDLNPSAGQPAFKFECPHCQQHISTDEDYSGKTVQCPTCGGEFVVPRLPEETAAEDLVSEAPEEEPDKRTNPSHQPPSINALKKPAKTNGWKSRKMIIASSTSIVILTTIVVFLVFPGKEMPDDITNYKSVEKILDSAVDQNQIQVQNKEGNGHFFSKNGKPFTGWIKGTRYYRVSLPYGRSYGVDYVNLLHVTKGKLDKELSFYAGTTNLKQYEIIYDTSSKAEKHGIEGVKSFRSWKPNGELCADTKVENGSGVVFEYDYHVYSQLTGGKSNTNVDPPQTKKIRYAGGKITSIEDLATEVSEKYAALETRNKEEQERKGRTLNETKLRENMLKAYPEISFDESNRMVDEIFGKTSSTTEENQRNRILDDIVLFSEKTGTSLSEALDHYKHWRETFSSEMLNIPSSKFDYECGKMVADSLTGAMTAAAGNAKASAQLGLDPKGNRSAWHLMNTNCSYHLAFTQGYQGYIALRSALGKGDMSDVNQNDANKILSRFENAKDRSERRDADIEAKRFNDSLTHASGSEQSNSDHGSNQHDSVAESTRTNRDSSEPPLAPLALFRNITIEEARECIQLLDAELKNDPGNERVKAAKSAIMDVFKSEASLIAAVSGTKDAEEQYRIKMQNLQVASRPSPLTGRVNTTEVERIRREAEAIKTGSESRVRNAKSALKRSIEEARRSAPAPDREALSRVWDQIERRNNL